MDVILQDLFEKKTVLIPPKITWAFLWGFFEGWVFSLATISVGTLQKVSELSTKFQINSYMYVLQMQSLILKNWLEAYFKTVICEKEANN